MRSTYFSSIFFFFLDMSNSEVNPEEVGFCVDQSPQRIHIVQWLSTLPFDDILKPQEPTKKFPGTAAVSLSRAQLTQYLKAAPTQHHPYKDTDILAWLQAYPRSVPALPLNTSTGHRTKRDARHETHGMQRNPLLFDFGNSEHSGFMCFSKSIYSLSRIDFGGSQVKTFVIVKTF